MPHDLATTNGRTALAYFGELPWHRLGTRLEEPTTAAEEITAAGLDDEVRLCPSILDGIACRRRDDALIGRAPQAAK